MGQARKIIVNNDDLGTTRVSKSLPGNYPGWPPSPVSQEGAVVRWLRDNVFAQDRQREVAAERPRTASRLTASHTVEKSNVLPSPTTSLPAGVAATSSGGASGGAAIE